MGSLTYRPYQLQYINGIVPNKSNLLISTMRSGKSAILKGIIDKHFANKRVLIVVGIRHIVLQLATYFDNHTFILSGKGYDSDESVHIASFQTLQRRDIDLSSYDMVAIDEANQRYATPIMQQIRKLSCTRIFMTGTPLKANGSFLDDSIDNILEFTNMKQMISDGYLAETKFMSRFNLLDTESKVATRNGDYDNQDIERIIDKTAVIDTLVNDNKIYQWDTKSKAILYVNSIKVAEEVLSKFNGSPNVKIIHSKLSKQELDNTQQWFESTSAGIIINVRMLTVGVDIPSADTILYLSPTKIISLFLQSIWRASTKHGDKVAHVYDYSGTLSRISPYFNDWYKQKQSCRDLCMKIKDPEERYLCMASCDSDGPTSGCRGELTKQQAMNPYISNFIIHKGEPCNQVYDVHACEFKSVQTQIGTVRKWRKCSCGCITSYDIQTIAEPSEMIAMYNDSSLINSVACIYDATNHRALAIFQDVTKRTLKVFEFESSIELYEKALEYFSGRKFSVSANVSIKLPNVYVDPSLDAYVSLINWSLKSQDGFLRKVVKIKLQHIAEHFGFKSGWVFYTMKTVSNSNMYEIMEFINSTIDNKRQLLSFFNKYKED